MRYVIAVTAFLVPLLVVVAIGTSLASGGPAATPLLGSAALSELRDFVRARESLLDRYACLPGTPETASMPHLALERFDCRGCAANGQPWYRLSLERSAAPCGIVRRQPGDSTAKVAAGEVPTLLVPLTQTWAYWEVVGPATKSP